MHFIVALLGIISVTKLIGLLFEGPYLMTGLNIVYARFLTDSFKCKNDSEIFQNVYNGRQ